jgi:hypothetical protein
VQACSTTTPQAHKLSHAVVGCSTRAKATAVAASLVSPQRRKKRRGKTKRVRDRRPPPRRASNQDRLLNPRGSLPPATPERGPFPSGEPHCEFPSSPPLPSPPVRTLPLPVPPCVVFCFWGIGGRFGGVSASAPIGGLYFRPRRRARIRTRAGAAVFADLAFERRAGRRAPFSLSDGRSMWVSLFFLVAQFLPFRGCLGFLFLFIIPSTSRRFGSLQSTSISHY